MAIKVNLLPADLAVNKNLGNVLKTVRALGLILTAGFLVFIIGIVAFYLISASMLKSDMASVDDLKSQIKSRETSEQQIVLLKDRLKKIESIRSLPNSLKNLSTIDPILSTLSPESSVTGLDVSPQKIGLLINFTSTTDLSNFFDNIDKSQTFKSGILSSFGFNPSVGYTTGLDVVPK